MNSTKMVTSKGRILVVFVALILMLSLAAVAQAAPASTGVFVETTSSRYDYTNWYFYSPCTNDYYVRANVSYHVVRQVRIDNDGGRRYFYRVNMHGKGIGYYNHSQKYIVQQVFHSNDWVEGSEWSYTDTSKLRLISKGAADNYLYDSSYTYAYDPATGWTFSWQANPRCVGANS